MGAIFHERGGAVASVMDGLEVKGKMMWSSESARATKILGGRTMEPRIIRTEADYGAGMAALDSLMDLDPAPGTPEADKLELLAMLLQQYEDAHFPADMPDPVDAILFRMDQQGLRNNDLEPLIGSKSKVSEVLNRKRPLSLAMIRMLHAGLGIPAEVLLQAPGKALPLDSDEDFAR